MGNNNWFWKNQKEPLAFSFVIKIITLLYHLSMCFSFPFLYSFFPISISLLEHSFSNVLPSSVTFLYSFSPFFFHFFNSFSFCSFPLHNPSSTWADPLQLTQTLHDLHKCSSTYTGHLHLTWSFSVCLFTTHLEITNPLSILFPSKNIATTYTFYYQNHIFFPNLIRIFNFY